MKKLSLNLMIVGLFDLGAQSFFELFGVTVDAGYILLVNLILLAALAVTDFERTGMDRREVHEKALSQAQTLLTWTDRLLPPKIADECIGDRWELIDQMAEKGASHWTIQLEALVGVSWGFVFAVGELGKLAVIWRLLAWLMR